MKCFSRSDFIAAMAALGFSAFAGAASAAVQTAVVDGISYEYTAANGEATIEGASPVSGEMDLPASIGGCAVTGIGDYAFYRCNGLTSVTIPDGVEEIGNGAFRDCAALESVSIPDSVEEIGYSAFYFCTAMEEMCFEGDAPAFAALSSLPDPSPAISVPAAADGWDEAARKYGFALEKIMSVPDAWFSEHGLGGYSVATLKSEGANGLSVLDSYVAGLDPSDPGSKFTAGIAIENGERKITWSPDLGDARVYRVEGKAGLSDAWAEGADGGCRFFRVRVLMP